MARTPDRPAVEKLPPAAWPRLADDLNAESFLRAGRISVEYLRAKGDLLYSFGGEQIGAGRLIDTIEALGKLLSESPAPEELDRKLKEEFELYRVNRSTAPRSAHFSSYYQPVIEASREKTEAYTYPIYKKPPDMIDADLGKFDPALKGKSVVGRLDESGRLVPYFDRRDIDVRQALAGKGLEIAWLKDAFDRLNLHIQGSGLLRFTDGTEAMARFAATNALPYKSVGMAVVGAGAMNREEITAETLRAYLKEHPEGEAWLISRNPRYTFFELAPLTNGDEPPGTIGRPLTAGRSIAIDPAVVPLGAVAHISLKMLQAGEDGGWLGKHPVSRFVHCQDTGGAIKGPGRVDIYVGHGPQAKAVAHNVWDGGALHILLKKLPPRRR